MELKNPADCLHELLRFGSGHYYIFCQCCRASWVLRHPNNGDQPSSGLDNDYHFSNRDSELMSTYREVAPASVDKWKRYNNV